MAGPSLAPDGYRRLETAMANDVVPAGSRPRRVARRDSDWLYRYIAVRACWRMAAQSHS